MNKLTLTATAAIAILLAGLSMNLVANSDSKATAAAQQAAKITLTEAISIAEQATNGKSTEAEFELENGISVYEVEILMADGSEIELEIGAQSGEILSQEREDEDDEQDDMDAEDGKA